MPQASDYQVGNRKKKVNYFY